MCFGGFVFRGVFRWLWCTVYMRHHLYLVSSIPCVLRGWRLIIFADSKKKSSDTSVHFTIINTSNIVKTRFHVPHIFKFEL